MWGPNLPVPHVIAKITSLNGLNTTIRSLKTNVAIKNTNICEVNVGQQKFPLLGDLQLFREIE
ncbi:hypothetical protein GDO81_002584 [Engystomops pustulosus]|uniref:Uncharacterized protein n=1 Tax=Engystomops pustulosus TaxID=76066 RepID=A0AAV7DP98_ENGPU|nr:hypothetical protein GDO81_002584 [Engystomops pustulosus]